MPTFNPPRNAFHRALRQSNRAINDVVERLTLADDIEAKLQEANDRVTLIERGLIATNERFHIATAGLGDRLRLAEIDIAELKGPKPGRPGVARPPNEQVPDAAVGSRTGAAAQDTTPEFFANAPAAEAWRQQTAAGVPQSQTTDDQGSAKGAKKKRLRESVRRRKSQRKHKR